MANDAPRVFDRLIGLETEYAIRYRASDPNAVQPNKYWLYEALRGELQRRVLTVPAKHFKEGVFTATGGAVWFEAERPSAGGGLIEGATPECRGPRQTVIHQRSLDRLLGESALAAPSGGEFCLIKNDRDVRDNIYGAQENYQATLASGGGLALWRLGLLLIFPIAALTWVGIFVTVIATLIYFALAGVVYLPVKLLLGGRRSLALLLFGRDLTEGRETCIHVPVWLEWTLQFATRVLTAPLACALFCLLRFSAFRRTRVQLLPFLISRVLITGPGLVDSQGRFQVADKAPAINCVLGFGGMLFDRPIFSMGHFFKAIYAESWFSPWRYFDLFSARQRLQIALGDSNMCEPAEYLRVGATALVLDMIEAGGLDDCPSIRQPVVALKAFCADPTLQTSVPLEGQNKRVTALDLQRFYLDSCRSFLNSISDPPAEAWEVIHVWETTLDELAELQAGAPLPESLIGKLDWVTKKYLVDKVDNGASWEELKKIDIRYHELSPQGYYQLLADSGMSVPIVTEDEVERALRSPPPHSPATTRGHYIREFAFGDEPVRANWKSVVIGSGWETRTIRLEQFGKPSERKRHWKWSARKRVRQK